MNEYFALVWGLLQNGLLVFALLIVSDILLGVVVALFIDRNFKWEKLAGFLQSDLLPVFAWVIVVFLSTIPQDMTPPGFIPIAVGFVYTGVFIKISASILGNLAKFGILQQPLQKVGFGDVNKG